MTETLTDPDRPATEDITVTGTRFGFVVPALINVALAGYNGWNWSQGQIGRATKALTIFPLCLLALKGFLILKPAFLRLSGGRLRVRLGAMLDISTPAENVEGMDLLKGKVRIRFQNVAKIECSQTMREFMTQRYSNTGTHIEFPLGKETDAYRRLRTALRLQGV